MARTKEFNPTDKLKKIRNLFWANGFQATSMQELVSNAQISKASMYVTFGDKRELFIKSLCSYADETLEAYKSATHGFSGLKAINAIVNKAIERTIEKQKVCLIVKATFEMAEQDDEIKKILVELNDRLVTFIETILQDAQQKKEIRDDANTKDLALYFVATLAGLWQMHTLYKDLNILKRLGKNLMQTLEEN